MKTSILTLVCITCVALSLNAAADDASPAASGLDGIRKIDLAVALKQYERLKMDAFENRLQLKLLPTHPQLSDEQRAQETKRLTERLDVFQREIDLVKVEIINLSTNQLSSTAASARALVATYVSTELARAKAELEALYIRYRDKHPKVVELNRKIEALETEARKAKVGPYPEKF